MFTLQKIAKNICHNRKKCDIRNIKSIYKKARLSISWVQSEMLLLIKSRLSSSILAIIRERIKF